MNLNSCLFQTCIFFFTPFNQISLYLLPFLPQCIESHLVQCLFSVFQGLTAVLSPQCRGPAHRSRSSSLSLTVESALESFDFLNTSDFDDEDTGDDNTAVSRSVFFDMETERIG